MKDAYEYILSQIAKANMLLSHQRRELNVALKSKDAKKAVVCLAEVEQQEQYIKGLEVGKDTLESFFYVELGLLEDQS